MRKPLELDNLIRQAREGQATAEAEFLARLRVRFVTVAKYYVGQAYAEDVAQDACIVVLQKYRSLAPDADFDAWALRVLKNIIGNHLRRLSVRRRHMDQSIDVEAVPESQMARSNETIVDLDRLQKCLAALSEAHPQHAASLLMAIKGSPTEEICRECGISRNNLYVMLHRARKWLTECLKKGGA